MCRLDFKENKFIGLSDSRLFHSKQVADKCYNLAKSKYSLDEDESRKMYVMGYLHDIGYAFSYSANEHSTIGFAMLYAIIDDKILGAIKHHGDPKHISDWTIYDKILNEADMLTDSEGYEVTFDERLEDIRQRHGESSNAYKNSKKIIDYLKEDKI